MTRYPDGRGGSYSRVIDLSSPDGPERGGLDPEAPVSIWAGLVRGRLHVGHTADLDDPHAPIFTDPRHDIAAAGLADLRCPGCVPRAAFGPFGDDTMIAIGHEPGCPWLAEMLAHSGITS